MKDVYIVPEITIMIFDFEDVITVSTPVTPEETTHTGGISVGGTGDGQVDFSNIP